MDNKVRRLRIIEYVGTEKWVNSCVEQRGIKGVFRTDLGIIRESMIGDTNELLSVPTVPTIAFCAKCGYEYDALDIPGDKICTFCKIPLTAGVPTPPIPPGEYKIRHISNDRFEIVDGPFRGNVIDLSGRDKI